MFIKNAPVRALWPDFEYLPHQTFGIRWMMRREQDSPSGGILADEMGLGKTIQMAGLLLNGRRGREGANLLVAPVAVLEQWKAVIRRIGFGVYVHGERGGWDFEKPAGEAAAEAIPGQPFVCVISYERMARYPALVMLSTWTRVIFDEAHRLVGGGTAFQVAQMINADSRWLLSATPVVNKLRDLRRLFGLLKLSGAEDLEPVENADVLERYILARSMDQLRAAIPSAPPAPQYKTISLPFETTAEADYYRGKMTLLTRRWEQIASYGNAAGAAAALEKLRLFMRLRQLSLHPQIYIEARKAAVRGLGTLPDWEGSSTKFEALRRLVREDPGQRWIIFCHFKHEMDMLRELFEGETGVGRVGVYNGTLTATEKEAVLAATKQPCNGAQVLLVQLQSGGTGLNLQHFNRIVFTGPWWTRALMEQAVGRAVRIGQREVVQVYHLILKEEEEMNIDAVMNEKANEKGALCQDVLSRATRDVA